MRRAALAVALLLAACGSSSGFDAVPTMQTVAGGTGLSGDVNVVYDGLGVPHVYAGSDADAAFALGYAQARDRLFQMDLFRKTATGRLGELLGANAPEAQDILLRTLFTSRQASSTGSHHVEDLIAEQLDATVRDFTQRYADGVNRWIADAQAGKGGVYLHPQYLALGISAAELAPWTVQDSLAIGRLQSFQLSDTTQNEVLAGQLAAAVQAGALPADVFADLTRHAQAVPSVILNSGNSPQAAALRRGARSRSARRAAVQASLAGALAWLDAVRLPLAAGDRAGSNNWSVAPSRSQSGHVLVANDPHLSLQDPSNFHLAHLVTPARNVAGVVFPGTPVVVIGHNDHIAWGDTVVGYDVTDLYVEQLDSAASPKTVLYQGAQVPLTVLPEVRHVRGVGDRPYAVYLVPHRGPILPGSIAAAGGGASALSVRWTGQDPTFEVQAFHELNAAQSVDAAFAALAKFGVGAQNFNVGDVQGHIGYDPHALVPIRPAGCVPWLPMDGTTAACDWQGFLSDAQLPQAKDPSKGYIATANNDVTGALVPPGPGQDANPLAAKPAYLYAYTDVGFREARIQEVLEGSTQHTFDGMTALQSDTRSLLAQTMLPGLLQLLAGQALSPGAAAVVQLWRGWDLSTPTGLEATAACPPACPPTASVAQSAAAATAFHAFLRRFADATLGKALQGAPVKASAIPIEQTMKLLVGLTQGVPGASPGSSYPLQAPRAAYCASTCAAEAAAALEGTVQLLGARLGADPTAWRWGDLHQVLFASPVAPLLPSFGPFPRHGGLFTVDVANFDLWTDAFQQRNGSNVRMVAELDPAGVRARMVIPGGQADRPPILSTGADHYMDQVPAWLANAPGDQPFAQAEVLKAATGRLVLSR